MSAPEFQLPDGMVTKLGCNVPDRFPTRSVVYADLPFTKIYTLDEIRSTLVGSRGIHKRRERFSGSKYIRNQGDKGSCNGWSTAGGLSRMRELRGEPYICLSGADAYSQMNGNQDNGSTLADGLEVVKKGIAPESMVPWDRIYSSQISAEAKASRINFRGVEPYPVDTEEEFASAIAVGYFGIVAVHATNSFNSEDGHGVNNGGNGPGNHSTLVQDVGMLSDGTLIYDQANSWGTNWCSNGYTYLTWNKHFRQTVQYHRFWILVSTSDNQSDEHKPPVAVV